MSILDWKKLGLEVPEIMMPKKSTDMKKWSVIACDQYTSEKAYWEKVGHDVGDMPSTLHQVIPEVYLENSDRLAKSASTIMDEYIENKIVEELGSGAILVERTFSDGKKRKGIMLAVDLDSYEYTQDARSLIRPSEGTIQDRIPPRLKLREQASLEYPHILILIDDPDKTAIEPLHALNIFEPLYDFELGWNGGRVKGNFIPGGALGLLHSALESLLEKSNKDYGEDFLMAVGDGNHSLATAKTHWSNIKATLSESEANTHPARFALIELVNLHDDGIEFEPIYRVVFNIDDNGQKKLDGIIEKHRGKQALELANLQNAIDEFLPDDENAFVDYVHGEESARTLAREKDTVAFFPEVITKDTLFRYIHKDGCLPRKAFSIGSANEKRFYLEGRKIK